MFFSFWFIKQSYLLALNSNKPITKTIIKSAENAYKSYMDGIETNLMLNKASF